MMRWLPMASGGISILTTLALIARDYPLIGHDYRYFIPRLIDTDLHLRLNGLSIQWYTPSFGGGMPAFPNPQHLQYSLIQALTFVSDPWIAVLVTTALVIAIGFWSCFQIARTHVGLGWQAATLAALFFVSNGFIIERAIVGHVGFQLFPLAAVMLWTLIDRRWPDVPRGALLGLTIALTLYHGGAIVIVLEAMTLALCLPLLVAFRPQLFDAPRLLRTSIAGAVFSASLAAPKVLAGMNLLRQFPREFPIEPVGFAHAVGGFLSQLAGVHTLAPILMIGNLEPERAYGAMVQLGAMRRYGVWELDIGLSPILFVCMGIGAWSMRTTLRQGWRSLQHRQRNALIALGAVVWIALEMSLGRGLVYPILKTWPILDSFHVNARFGAVFILPMAMCAAIVVDRWLTGRPAVGALLIATTLLAPLTYFLLPSQLHDRRFDVAPLLREVPSLRQSGGHVDRLAAVSDADGLFLGASSLRPYDPLFGYANESFTPETHEGDIRVATNGYWNMTDPSGLVFPIENGVRKFERIREADRDRLEQFLQRRQPDWALPPSVVWATRVAIAALFVCGLTIGFGFRRRRVAE